MNVQSVISYTLVGLAGLCFLTGISFLRREGDNQYMESLENAIEVLDHVVNTPRKRHIAECILVVWRLSDHNIYD